MKIEYFNSEYFIGRPGFENNSMHLKSLLQYEKLTPSAFGTYYIKDQSWKEWDVMLSETGYYTRSFDSPHLSGNADVLLIREDLAEEWGAVIGYLECGNEVKDRLISKQFYEAAQDEIGHIIRLTRMLAVLDQVQAEALIKSGLLWLSGFEHQTALPPLKPKEASQVETDENFRSGNHGSKKYFEPDEKTMECLRNAIRDELLAVNVYQRQLESINNQMLQNILVSITNQKKEHVAGFTASLYNLLREYRLPVGSII